MTTMLEVRQQELAQENADEQRRRAAVQHLEPDMRKDALALLEKLSAFVRQGKGEIHQSDNGITVAVNGRPVGVLVRLP
jgi:hypothetical protein